MPRVSLSLLILLACLAAGPVYGAACSSPAGNEADAIYNGGYHTWQFCNGTSWRAFAGAAFQLVSSGSGCINPQGNEADQIYNKDYHTWQFCNGTNWVSFGAASATWPNGYFVLSKSTWNGNLGGRAGADALCLTELTTNTGWMGYSTANSEGLLVSGNVHAFLCDGTECNILLPSTTYIFANANSASAGGASFTTDSMGYGPNDSQNWSGSTYFNTSANYWVATTAASSTEWIYSQIASTCTGWTIASGNCAYGTANSTTGSRWAATTALGSGTEHLICYVNP